MFSTLPASGGGGGGGGGGDEWQQFADDQGYPFWYNPSTDVSTYDDPNGGPPEAPAPEPVSPSWASETGSGDGVVVPSKASSMASGMPAVPPMPTRSAYAPGPT